MKSNKVRLLICLMVCFASSLCFAQTPKEIESQMDEIRVDENCIYGENSNEDKDMAFQNALTELTIFANEIRADKGKDVISSSDLLTVVKELRYQKGNRYTVLVYLPVSQMLGITSKSYADVVTQTAPSQSSQSNSAPQQAKEQGQKFTFVPKRQQEETQTEPVKAPLSDDIVQTLCSQDNWIEIKGFLSTYKGEGKISAVGNVLNYAEVPDDAYAILMDDMGGILSILSPQSGGNRFDFRTNQTYNETNHGNCKFIVWYK